MIVRHLFKANSALQKQVHRLLLIQPTRSFPRAIYKEQQLQRQSKYSRMREPEPEKSLEERDSLNSGNRKLYEQFKEGERAYQRFEQETGAQDPEMEKEMDRLISEKMALGLGDEEIMQQILGGGGGQGSSEDIKSNKDVWRVEEEKMKELMEEMQRMGKTPISMEQGIMFGDEKEAFSFEEFQQRAGKMMFQEDEILMEKWAEEEKQRRIEERTQPKGPIYQSTKAKRQIEGSQTFGYVKETDEAQSLLKNTMKNNTTDQERRAIKSQEMEEEDNSLDSFFEGMKDDEFTKAVDKLTTKDKSEAAEIRRLKKEASRHTSMTPSDKKLKSLAELDSDEASMAAGEEVIREEKRIVGKDARTLVDKEILGDAKGKLTTEQKIKKELAYVKEALDLTDGQAKHWYYQLKREYEDQERREKLLAQLKARKEFRKMMKSYKLPSVLQQEEDYEKFYDAPDTKQKPQEEERLAPQYENDKEALFYKDDLDFLRFHKRTTKNVHEELQSLINSAKQTIYSGIKQNYQVILNYVKLNRSSSVVEAYWTINRLDKMTQQQQLKFGHGQEVTNMLTFEAEQRKDEIEKFKETLVKKALAENDQLDPAMVRQQIDQRPLVQYLQIMDQDKERVIEAEIQKRLTKAVPFFRGKLTQNIGLRYAPEIRFYRDNSIDIFTQFREQAREYLKETSKDASAAGKMDLLGAPKESQDLLQRIRTYKKMDPYERRMLINQSTNTEQRDTMTKLLMSPGQLEQVEAQLSDMIMKRSAITTKNQELKNEKDAKAHKPTRRDKRAEKEMQKLKDKISEASQADFDLLSEEPLNPSQMEESLLGIASEVRPTKDGLESSGVNTAKKYTIDPQSGDKIRLKGNSPRTTGKSKADRRQERSVAFWDRL